MKNMAKLLGIIAISAIIGMGLAGCKNDSDSGSKGCPNPNGTCWQKGGTDFSFCGQSSCDLAYDYSASCKCGK